MNTNILGFKLKRDFNRTKGSVINIEDVDIIYGESSTSLDEDAVEIVKKTFPYCYDEMLGFDAVGLDFVKLLSEQITNWKTMNRANCKMGERINELESGIKKFVWHWQSYFNNKIVGNPPDLQDLLKLIADEK